MACEADRWEPALARRRYKRERFVDVFHCYLVYNVKGSSGSGEEKATRGAGRERKTNCARSCSIGQTFFVLEREDSDWPIIIFGRSFFSWPSVFCSGRFLIGQQFLMAG